MMVVPCPHSSFGKTQISTKKHVFFTLFGTLFWQFLSFVLGHYFWVTLVTLFEDFFGDTFNIPDILSHKGRMAPPKRMNFRKNSKRPLTPPHFRKIILRISRQNCDKSAYVQSQSAMSLSFLLCLCLSFSLSIFLVRSSLFITLITNRAVWGKLKMAKN